MEHHPSMPGHISVYESSRGSVCVVLAGEFDISNSEQLARELRAARDGTSSREIEVDLSRVRFFGVAPAAVLVDAAFDAVNAGCGLAVTATSRQARRTLELTGVDEEIMNARRCDRGALEGARSRDSPLLR